jgi:hypothetical protein
MSDLILQYTPKVHNKGDGRGKNPREYTENLRKAIQVLAEPEKRKGKNLTKEETTKYLNELRLINKERLSIPSIDHTPDTIRVYYTRYADDLVIGIRGPKTLAEEIKFKATQFLWEKLKIKVNEEKTHITNITKDRAHFLGVEIFIRNKKYTQSLVTKNKGLVHSINRKVNPRIIMYAPIGKIVDKLISQGFAHPDRKPKAMKK